MRLWNGNGTGTGFYFAPQADLSMCQQEFFRRKQANQPYTSNLMKKKGYIWNYDLLKDFLLQGISHKWLTPVIQGYCRSGEANTFLGRNLNVVIISRRHTARAGTRFYSRGIDEDGSVANFVETEVIINFNHGQSMFAHLQVRGSVPLFWA